MPYNILNIWIFGGPSSRGGGVIHMCAHWLFCKKFNGHQLLFEWFFEIMRIFGSIPPESESTFPFQYNIIFETYQFLEPRNSSPRGDRHVRPLTYIQKFNSEQFLFEQFFYIICNFGSVEPSSEPIFPFQHIIIFQKWQSFGPRSSSPGGDTHVRPLTYVQKFNSEHFLFEQFFDIIRNFGSVEPWSEHILLFHYIIIFQR